jgi:hypothetical protein
LLSISYLYRAGVAVTEMTDDHIELSLEVHLGPDFAPPVYHALRPTGEARHERQATPCTAFPARRLHLRGGTGPSGVADAEGERVVGDLVFQFDSVAAAASVTDRVRNEVARHEQQHPRNTPERRRDFATPGRTTQGRGRIRCPTPGSGK